MARRPHPRDALPPVMRCDLLPSNMTAGKEARGRDLLAAYRNGAVLLGREQWRLLFETGRFNKNHDKDKITFAAVIGAAPRVQMARWQVIGHRANEFHDGVNGSSLDPNTRHMLHVINRAGAWFARKDVVMRDTGRSSPTMSSGWRVPSCARSWDAIADRTCRASPCGSTSATPRSRDG